MSEPTGTVEFATVCPVQPLLYYSLISDILASLIICRKQSFVDKRHPIHNYTDGYHLHLFEQNKEIVQIYGVRHPCNVQ